jgi:spermidine synthase
MGAVLPGPGRKWNVRSRNADRHKSGQAQKTKMRFTQCLTLLSMLTSATMFGAADDVPLHRVGEIEQSIGFYQAIGLTENSLLYATQSKYQAIEVHQTKHFGKLLLLDGVIQLTERDADSYNEMMAHVPMFQHPNPKSVLVIGGGDGYVLKEVLKHPSVVRVDHVDLDEGVIETCKIHFPQWGDCWEDPRATLHIEDGAQFVREVPDGFYDVIIQDSSDPWVIEADGSATPLPSGVLYDANHICELQRILAPNGVLNLQVRKRICVHLQVVPCALANTFFYVKQGESFNVPSNIDGIVSWRNRMEACGFTRSRYGSIMTVSYTTGHIGMLLGEKDPSLSSKDSEIRDRYDQMVQNGGKTTYYHPGLQRSAFDLPLWAHQKIYGGEDTSDLRCKRDDQLVSNIAM